MFLYVSYAGRGRSGWNGYARPHRSAVAFVEKVFESHQMPVASEDVHLAPDVKATCAYLVGRDPEGHWLAVETHGRGGGLFTTCDAALHYARGETERRPGAVQMASAPIMFL